MINPLRIPLCLLTAGSLMAVSTAAGSGTSLSPNICARSSFDNCRHRFEHQHRGHVAFLGGSITEMNGYRPMVCEYLAEQFPGTEFTWTNAGIASTCSTTGAFRLSRDVLSQGPVDLIFIEFAVNDDQDAAHSRTACIRGLEGIIRQCRRHNPRMDIVVTYFVNPGMRKLLQEGKTPVSIAAHEEVCAAYGVSTVHLAREVAERMTAGKLTWQEFGGTHPARAGNRLCADMIRSLLESAWKGTDAGSDSIPEHTAPATLLDEFSYVHARFVDPATATRTSGWSLGIPDWDSLPGSKRGRFTGQRLLHATGPGEELRLEFTGRAIGAYLLAGPDAAMVDVTIDDGPSVTHDLFHRFSAGLHYPRTVMFASELPPGDHVMRLRISDQHNPESSGTAVRILQFCAN